MRFALRLAAREARSSWRRLLFFFLSLTLGVGTMVAVRSLVESLRGSLSREARTLLAADLVVATSRPWDEALRARLETVLRRPGVGARSETLLTGTMASPARTGAALARLVELRGLDAAFPLYGRVELEGGAAYRHELLAGRGALVSAELLAQLDLRVGDELLLGGERFTVRGVVLREPGRRPSAFSLGPRVLVDLADLRASGLLGFGARASHQLLLRVDEGALEPLRSELRRAFPEEFVSIRSWKTTESQFAEALDRAEGYLSLVGFAVLVLGGVGVSSVVRVFVQEKRRSVAILKCLGARPGQVLLAYLLQVVGLALLGGVLGLLLARMALAALPAELLGSVGDVALALSWSAALQGLLLSVLVALLFALPPLLEVRRVKPLLVLRDEPAPRGGDPLRRLAVALAVVGLLGLAALSAGSLQTALVASAGLALVALLLLALSAVLVRAAGLFARRLRFPLRQALLRLGRPGNTTRPVVLALGLGSFFVLALYDLRAELLRQLDLQRGSGAADLFLIDVQPDQAEALQRFLAGRTPAPARLVPVLRARVTGVVGRELRLEDAEDVRGRGGLAREFVVTYRDRLEANERVLEGAYWGPGEAAAAEVSIEKSLRDRFGLRLGDELRFDVLGRIVKARVTSVREVAWSDSRSAGGFMFVFRPGTLRGAPEARLGFVQAPAAAAERARLQRDLALAFPNVSSLDLREVLATLERLLARLSLAISAVGAVTLLLGVLILVGTVALSRFERRREGAVLRTLGARPGRVALLLAVEQLALGAVAGLAGGLGALALSGALCEWVLKIPWHPAWGALAAGAAATALGAALVGALSSLDVLRARPLAVLREG